MNTRALLPLIALSLASCAVGPDFLGAPDQELPAGWVNHLPPASDAHSLTAWWDSFGDPQLSALIARGFEANPDMVSAALSVAAAESQLRSVRSGLFPGVSASAGGSNSGSYQTSTSHGSWSGALSASWTPDIWGGTRREVEAAAATLGSQYAAAAATRTALAGSIAAAYIQWITAKESLRIAREQLAYQERTYSIAKQRYDNGMSTGLDLAESQATIASTRAQIPQYEANILSYENALATYLGTTVDKLSLSLPAPAVYNRIPAVPTGLPSDLLRRRPDIVRAEHELHAATARIGVSVADLFPKLSLTGSTGSRAGSDFAQFWKNSTWDLGASVGRSILNNTTLNEAVRQAELTQQKSVQSYRQTVLAAFAEVENCLIDYARLTNQLPRYEEAAAANRRSAELSLQLFNAGNKDFLNVAAAERQWLSSELSIIAARQNIRLTLAKLCTALGGGWEP